MGSMPTVAVSRRWGETRGHTTSFAANAPTRAPHPDGHPTGHSSQAGEVTVPWPRAPTAWDQPTEDSLACSCLSNPADSCPTRRAGPGTFTAQHPKALCRRAGGDLPASHESWGHSCSSAGLWAPQLSHPGTPFTKCCRRTPTSPHGGGSQNVRLFSDGQDTNRELRGTHLCADSSEQHRHNQ